MKEATKPTALQKLINEQKGFTVYKSGQTFMLHVFWEAPNRDAAERLLEALNRCAIATYRDTPCVPTYFFRISNNDANLYGDAPKLVKDHAQLAAAIKKLGLGVPRAAVLSDLAKRNLDPKYLDLDLLAELPPPLQGQKPVAIEFTELYLDERAFMQHAGSRDYLDAYGTVMSPGLSNRIPTTLRFGNPTQDMIEKILEPMLREQVTCLSSDSTIWNQPGRFSKDHFVVSVDYESVMFDSYVFSSMYQNECVWSVRFRHPIRDNVTRLMTLLIWDEEKSTHLFKEITDANPIQGEIYAANEELEKKIQLFLHGNTKLVVNNDRKAGYLLHAKVSELVCES
ncbi:hypothetical protein ROZALSC1DRAFT_27441 [Rozella allomycis CSF55]|uniref:Uncharacterized protein n=1 Tax=Rozella allomycis (strain CSF55) TaxID=988480 RepID=A0A075AV47_ROZAC|nr:hypothetical protein O9G_001336 [Rozella allomycis CSF55]RKP21129.1 hypothetical protein ROZALSC1DRAFT_27441 [Rozella allomycis CSF55]|eukprot:EPZ32434.1 hypothetical protein O9G_001336 [Rozella allomycis CSF55]